MLLNISVQFHYTQLTILMHFVVVALLLYRTQSVGVEVGACIGLDYAWLYALQTSFR